MNALASWRKTPPLSVLQFRAPSKRATYVARGLLRFRFQSLDKYDRNKLIADLQAAAHARDPNCPGVHAIRDSEFAAAIAK